MTSPPAHGPIRVLLAFPPDPPASEVEKIRQVDPRLEVRAHAYFDPSADRPTNPSSNPPDHARFVEELAAAHVVLALDLPEAVARVAPNLLWVQAIGAGVEQLLGAELPADAMLTNAAGLMAVPIAEFVIARLLGVWKRTNQLDALQRDHRWKATYGRQLAGCSLLVVGLGAIGSAVAERAAALGMRVFGIRAHPRPHPSCTEVAGPDRLEEFLGQADAVVLSAPATASTAEMFDASAFSAMRRGAVFCNVARGALVDEDALAHALNGGQLGAAILDVTRTEPLPADSPLWDLPNCAISPHSSSAPSRYVTDLYSFFAANLRRWLNGEELENVVDQSRGY